VLAGNEATDGRSGAMAGMIGEVLGWPSLTHANQLSVADGTASIKRETDEGTCDVTASLPAVVSVAEKINEPRYPSFKGIMAAKKKPVQTLALADLGIDADAAGLAGSASAVADFAARPPRASGVITKDEGDGGTKVAAFLAERKVI
jgi:electron transfer flavoprotein beta subunit